jgi:hypothetical protein
LRDISSFQNFRPFFAQLERFIQKVNTDYFYPRYIASDINHTLADSSNQFKITHMKQTMKTQRCKQQSFCWLTLAVSLFSNSTAVRGLTAPSTPHIARPAVRLRAVTDPATLLGAARTAIGANTNRNQTVDFYYATDEIPQSPSINLNGDRKKSETIVLATKSASSSIRSRRKAKLLPKKSRSSTMPGYRTKTHNQLSHSKNIAFLEGQTGKDMSFLHESSSRTGGEAMYQTSSSVPDSLVQFARELHQVRKSTRFL